MVFGVAVLLPLSFVGRGARVTPGLLRATFLCGFFFALDIMCWHRAILAVGPGLATAMGNFQVFFLALLAFAVKKERPARLYWLSLPPAFLGMYMMVGAGWDAASADWKMGVFWGLATAVFYAAYLLRLQMTVVRLKVEGTGLMAAVTLWTAVLVGGYALAQGLPFGLGAKDFLWLALLGCLCQGAGWMCITRGMKMVSAAVVGLLLLLQPTLSFIWDILLFAKPVDPVEIGGLCMALAAIYMGSRGTRR